MPTVVTTLPRTSSGMPVVPLRQAAALTTPTAHHLAEAQRMDLNTRMQFDLVIQVHPDGTVTDAPDSVDAPELDDGQLQQGGPAGDGWSLMDGYSSQDRYSGPIMHTSESVGGQLERDILAAPGYYVTLADYHRPDDDTPDDDTPAGWAVARRDC